jgi:hypothetical protein
VSHYIVAVQGDVESASPQRLVGDLLEHLGKALGEHVAARTDADQGEVLGAAIPFEDFVRDARQRTAQAIGVHDDGHQESLDGR